MNSSVELMPVTVAWRDRASALALPAASLAVAALVLLAWQYLPPALGVP